MKNMKAIIGIVFQIMIALLSYGQTTPSNSETFRITKSHMNGENITKFDLERGGVLIFDLSNNQISNLKNYSEVSKTNSFGIVEDYKADTSFIAGSKYRKINAKFNWQFKNSYNSLSGIAQVEFKQTETSYGTDFKLKMKITKTRRLIEYSGFKDGTRSNYILNETNF